MTQPTIGLGSTVPLPRAASPSARRMNDSSFAVDDSCILTLYFAVARKSRRSFPHDRSRLLAGLVHQDLLSANFFGRIARRALDVRPVRLHIPGTAAVVEHNLQDVPQPLPKGPLLYRRDGFDSGRQ